jgi:hypothetical protein
MIGTPICQLWEDMGSKEFSFLQENINLALTLYTFLHQNKHPAISSLIEEAQIWME